MTPIAFLDIDGVLLIRDEKNGMPSCFARDASLPLDRDWSVVVPTARQSWRGADLSFSKEAKEAVNLLGGVCDIVVLTGMPSWAACVVMEKLKPNCHWSVAEWSRHLGTKEQAIPILARSRSYVWFDDCATPSPGRPGTVHVQIDQMFGLKIAHVMSAVEQLK